MEKSFRIVWELDIDAADARQAAELAKAAFDSGLAPVISGTPKRICRSLAPDTSGTST
jgi:hypothetical protein